MKHTILPPICTTNKAEIAKTSFHVNLIIATTFLYVFWEFANLLSPMSKLGHPISNNEFHIEPKWLWFTLKTLPSGYFPKTKKKKALYLIPPEI